MRVAQFLSVFSLAFFALAGGCLILAQEGFTTSSKRGHWSVFVPLPEAWLMAAIMFALSFLGLVWLLREARIARSGWLLGLAAWLAAAWVLVRLWVVGLQ